MIGLAAGYATHLSVVAALANVFNDSDAVERARRGVVAG